MMRFSTLTNIADDYITKTSHTTYQHLSAFLSTFSAHISLTNHIATNLTCKNQSLEISLVFLSIATPADLLNHNSNEFCREQTRMTARN